MAVVAVRLIAFFFVVVKIHIIILYKITFAGASHKQIRNHCFFVHIALKAVAYFIKPVECAFALAFANNMPYRPVEKKLFFYAISLQ